MGRKKNGGGFEKTPSKIEGSVKKKYSFSPQF
jgi:hypothetical protein